MRVCWCGNTDLIPYSAEYGKCARCGTLVSLKGMSPEKLLVLDDDTDFYGKKYWLEHQKHDLDNPDIHDRARNDLAERNLHWLRILLKYCLPPANVLELGCAHGSFVALMQHAGFNASGSEMSPWVVAFAKQTFGVHMYTGPIETINIPPKHLDVIALMDVLEHLPDPVATMRCCFELLKPDGLLLVQTPQFNERISYKILVDSNSRFLDQFKADEHLYLFSERSVAYLFQQLGAEYIYFEPAIFAHYDMFFIVSRTPHRLHDAAEIENALLDAPNKRFVLALLDLTRKYEILSQRFEESETDRAARYDQIVELTQLVKKSDADRAVKTNQFTTFRKLFEKLKEAKADCDVQSKEIMDLKEKLKEAKADCDALCRLISCFLLENSSERTPEQSRFTNFKQFFPWVKKKK